MVLLTLHAAAVWALTGVTWVVQLVVYPGFLTVGPTAAWPAFHAAHSRGIAAVVALPWAVQGGTLAVLLTVVVTLVAAVPLHERLDPYNESLARLLLRAHTARTAAWTAGAFCAAGMLLAAG